MEDLKDQEPIDDDNLYVYTEEEKEEEEKNINPGPRKKSPLALMFEVLFNPGEGWKNVRRASLSAEEAQKGCFLPLLIILSLCNFASIFYNPSIAFIEVAVKAIITFVSFFFGFFCIMILLRLILPSEVKETISSEFGKVFVLLCLSTLCLFYSFIEIFPMLWAILIFLPLWTVYSICNGSRFFKFPEDRQIYCNAVMCLLIIGIPTLLDWILGEVLNF